MPSPTTLLAFAAVSFVLVIIPGPSVLFIVSRAVAHGRRVAVETVVGNAAGVVVQVVLVASGLGVVVPRSAAVFTVVKLAGAAYLVWLGVQAIASRRSGDRTSTGAAETRTARRSSVLDGFVVGVANPKVVVFLAAFLPQFVVSGGAPAAAQMAVLGLVFVVVALVCDGVWGLAAGTARDWFVRSPRRMSRLQGLGGVTMVILGVRLATTGRAD